MDHQIFAALFVLALIGQFLATAAPLSDNRQHQKKGHHQHHNSDTSSTWSSVEEIEEVLKQLDKDTTVLIADKDKVTEIFPEQKQLPAGTSLPAVSGRFRRSTRRRSRRSAALLLHATLRMCDLRPLNCQSIMLQRDNVRVNIRLVDQ